MLRGIICCIGLAGTIGCATAGESATRVQASEDQAWAAGPTLDSGLTGTVVVLNKAEASASLLDAGSGRELARVQVGSGPHEVAISPDGTTAVVTNYGRRSAGNTLTVIDLVAMRALATIDLGDYHRPHGIQYFPDGKRVAVTAEAEQAVIIVDVESRTVTTAVKTAQEISHMLVLSPDASRIYVSSIVSGTVTVVDVAAGTVVGTVATGAGAEGLDISPDGTEVWVGNRADDTLSILDTESLAITATIPCPGFPIRVKFTVDGKHVLVSNATAGAVAVFDAAGRNEIQRIDVPAVPVGILAEPSGRYAFVASTSADTITVLDLATWTVFGRVTAGKEPDGLGYSPARSRSAVAR